MTETNPSLPAAYVNVKQVFYTKNPRLAKWIPNFIFQLLKKIIHEDEMNAFLKVHGQKLDIEFITAVIDDFNLNIKTVGEENIPASGRFIFCANHPFGGFDGMVLLKILTRHYTKVQVLVNDILMNMSNLRNLFIPINKHGSLAFESARRIEEVFQSNCQLVTFPAGLVSRRQKGVVRDLQWQKSFIIKSVQHKRDIIPIHFSGENSNFFYNLSAIRRFFGIKANIEMILLADETFKHRNKNLTVTFGKPIPWQTFNKSKKPLEWANWVKDKVYELNV